MVYPTAQSCAILELVSRLLPMEESENIKLIGFHVSFIFTFFFHLSEITSDENWCGYCTFMYQIYFDVLTLPFLLFPVLFIGISQILWTRMCCLPYKINRHLYQKPLHISPPFSVRLHFFCIDCTFNSRRRVDSILCITAMMKWCCARLFSEFSCGGN